MHEIRKLWSSVDAFLVLFCDNAAPYGIHFAFGLR